MVVHNESTINYSGNSIAVCFYKDTARIEYGSYSMEEQSVTGGGSSSQSTLSVSILRQGLTPALVSPTEQKIITYFQKENLTDNRVVAGQPNTQGRQELYEVKVAPFLFNQKSQAVLYSQARRDSVTIYNAPALPQSSYVTASELVFDRSRSETADEVEVTIPILGNISDYTNDARETLAGMSLYWVPSQDSAKYDRGFWQGKKRQDYANQPNVFAYPDLTKELKKVPVFKAVVNPETQQIEVKDDVIVKKVFPLVENAVVLAASYYPA